MPNIKSAIRKVKRAKKQTIVNKVRKNKYKQALKTMQKFIEKKDIKGAKKYFPDFQSELMKIAKTGIIKKKNLSRKISKISKKIKKITK
jgi:small subunit ribosomal protein S20|tara:strand:- start:9462 stop:9728 length:267 start_codon:yes stop_codon:yes gene_type:complete